MSKASERVKKWRDATKARIVEAMGGKCVCCGYNDCDNALDLHHLNPDEKEIGLSRIRANPISWEKIVSELRKCILVCCRCHREIHDEFRTVPDNVTRFDEKFVIYKITVSMDICPVCQKEKIASNKTCSRSCAATLARKVDWDKINLIELLKTKSISQIADELNVSWNAVKKRTKKLNIIPPCRSR